MLSCEYNILYLTNPLYFQFFTIINSFGIKNLEVKSFYI